MNRRAFLSTLIALLASPRKLVAKLLERWRRPPIPPHLVVSPQMMAAASAGMRNLFNPSMDIAKLYAEHWGGKIGDTITVRRPVRIKVPGGCCL